MSDGVKEGRRDSGGGNDGDSGRRDMGRNGVRVEDRVTEVMVGREENTT